MPKLKLNKALERAFFSKKPIIVPYGGRGSGKSIGVGDIMTYRMQTEAADIYCLRQFQKSIKDSVHRVFEESVRKRLMLPGWDIQKTAVIAPNGATTTYTGANLNPDAMQSAQSYKYSWFEEAHTASEDAIDKLLPTIIRNPGAQAWFTANPQSSADPFSQRFLVPYYDELETYGYYEDNVHLIFKVNWRDNPWWNDELELLRSWDFDHLSRAKYDWIWEGKFNDQVEDALIEPEWFDSCLDAVDKLGITPTGARVSSLDPADTGNDKNAYASRKGIHFDQCMEIDKANGNLACDVATDLAITDRTDLFVWDGDGMGALLRKQIAESFKGINHIEARMYKGSNSVDDPDVVYDGVYADGQKTNKELFYNKRAQYYVELARRMKLTHEAVTMDKYTDPDELVSISSKIPLVMKLRAELCGIPRKKNLTGKIALMPKEEMLAKFGRKSPNMADCLAMCMETPVLNKKPVKLDFEGW